MNKMEDWEDQYDKIYRYCYFKVHHRQLAEDLTQETFLRFWESRGYREIGKSLQYLYTIARNLCVDEFRKPQMYELTQEESKQEMEKEILERLAVQAALGKLDEEDRELLAQMVEAYRKIPQISDRHYLGTSEYQQYARPYSAIFTWVLNTTSLKKDELMYEWQPSEEEYYQMYSILWEKVWDAYYLTEGEKQFWRGEVEKIRKPFIFHEIGRYERFFGIFQTLGVFVLLLQTISLAGMFSEEHSRRTDQINLCTLKGRRSLYWAKIAAGVSYAVFSVVITFTVGYAGVTILYGKGHAEALFQYVYSFYTETLNCGQAVWIAMGMVFECSETLQAYFTGLGLDAVLDSQSVHFIRCAYALSVWNLSYRLAGAAGVLRCGRHPVGGVW